MHLHCNIFPRVVSEENLSLFYFVSKNDVCVCVVGRAVEKAKP